MSINVISDKDEWNHILDEEFNTFNDIYYRYEYFCVYARHYKVVPESVFWCDENTKIFWTYMIRDISEIETFKGFEFYDLTTPYGYGGPLIIAKTKFVDRVNKSIKFFLDLYKKHALKNDYVCEFIRFHPIFENWKFLDKNIEVVAINDVVLVDITNDLERIWMNIKKGHKYNIRKSIREECEVNITTSPNDSNINNFIKMYYYTMDKNNALKKYYFSKNFIKDHFKMLNSVFVEVKKNNEVLGIGMFIYNDDSKIIHYYLSARGFNNVKGVYPSDLIIWEIIKWSKKNGFKCLLMGGGVGNNDSLFKFKKAFSDATKTFKIGKIIFNKHIYDKLIAICNNTSTSFFPIYRNNLNNDIFNQR